MIDEFFKLYTILPSGVIKQKSRASTLKYDTNYIDVRYTNRFDKAELKRMATLRFGGVVGAIGHVPSSLLDVGYGDGAFLKVAADIVPNVYGFDIEPAYPLNDNRIQNVASITSQHYELVSFFDSLEHFENIYEIGQVKADYIYISVPWSPYQTKADIQEFMTWKHRRVDEHLWHFNAPALKNFMNELGFEEINHSNIEDIIRKPEKKAQHRPNILTACFRQKVRV